MKCSKCGGEEFYKAYWGGQGKPKEEGFFLVCFKCRVKYPLQGSEQKTEEAKDHPEA